MFSHPDYDGHEALLFTKDAASGLRALIAIHDTTLGPAFGGCRMYSASGCVCIVTSGWSCRPIRAAPSAQIVR